MNTFLTSNDAKWRLARTIVQGVIGVIIANLDTIIGLTPVPATVKPLIVAIVMACLSPIMATMGGADPELRAFDPEDFDEVDEDE